MKEEWDDLRLQCQMQRIYSKWSTLKSIIILGKKNFPLEEITSQDEYSVQITIPDLKKKDEIAALVNSKITLHWSDYQFFEEKKKNCENKLLKLKEASSKVNKYLNQIQEIYVTSQNNYNSEKTQATKRHVFPYDSNFNNYETISGNDLNDFDTKEKEPKDELTSKLNNIYGNDKFGVGYEEVRSGYENEVNVNTKNSNRNRIIAEIGADYVFTKFMLNVIASNRRTYYKSYK